MVAYSFKARFEAPILADIKVQTIRGDRRRHARPQEPMQLYVGMRTRGCRLIGTRVCQSIQRIMIDVDGASVHFPRLLQTITDQVELDAFAVRDGFVDWCDMQRFWRQEHPNVAIFSGWLISWAPLVPRPA